MLSVQNSWSDETVPCYWPTTGSYSPYQTWKPVSFLSFLHHEIFEGWTVGSVRSETILTSVSVTTVPDPGATTF